MKYFLALFMVLGVWNLSEAAMCGDSEYFEYQFKPLSAKPVKPEDVEHAHGRCGMGEKHCELMFMINGKPKCKKTKQAGNGIALMGPDSKNDVSGREFNPHKVDWTVHSDWELSKAYEHPLIIQLCDHDSAFRGGHDQIISESHQHLEKGCHQHTKQDDHKTHPWVMKYELCCRPIAKQGFFRGQKGGKFHSTLAFVLFLCCQTGFGAKCGRSEYFEFKFKPLSARPVHDEDANNAHGRCGLGEMHCEVIMTVNGKSHCNTENNRGITLRGPDRMNVVNRGQFRPAKIDWMVHSDWDISHAPTTPLTVELCDHDTVFRAGNDKLIRVEHKRLQEGCHEFKKRDQHRTNPWEMAYEICCRPIPKPAS